MQALWAPGPHIRNPDVAADVIDLPQCERQPCSTEICKPSARCNSRKPSLSASQWIERSTSAHRMYESVADRVPLSKFHFCPQ